MLNHGPHQQGQWFDYNGWRYKDYYDVKLKTGKIIPCCYPNGNGWYPFHGSYHRIDDGEVAEIRMVSDSETPAWESAGAERIQRNIDMFKEHIPSELLPD